MKTNIKNYQPPPLLEDTLNYVETAKRVRKHDRRVTACVLLSILFMTFMRSTVASYKDGARFTLRSEMNYGAVKINYFGRSMFDEENPDEKSEITYIGNLIGKRQHLGGNFSI